MEGLSPHTPVRNSADSCHALDQLCRYITNVPSRMTNIRGVLDKQCELLTELTQRSIDELIADGTISVGMLPKQAGAIDAAKSGVDAVHVVHGRVLHAMLPGILTDQA